MTGNHIQMVISDLDGTLLNHRRRVADRDMKTLRRLGERGVLRVVATGRNHHSLSAVLPEDFPLDYLLYSSGAGIFDWKRKKLIRSFQLPGERVGEAAGFFISREVDFMIHDPIPENHRFLYYRSSAPHADFQRRFRRYAPYARSLNLQVHSWGTACQIVAITGRPPSFYNQVRDRLKGARVIRTTSPLDGETLWIEVFPWNVCKGKSAEWLCRRLGISPDRTLGIGNDYNDLDLLEFTAHSFVVGNAPQQLKKQYPHCRDHRSCGFSDAVKRLIGPIQTPSGSRLRCR